MYHCRGMSLCECCVAMALSLLLLSSLLTWFSVAYQQWQLTEQGAELAQRSRIATKIIKQAVNKRGCRPCQQRQPVGEPLPLLLHQPLVLVKQASVEMQAVMALFQLTHRFNSDALLINYAADVSLKARLDPAGQRRLLTMKRHVNLKPGARLLVYDHQYYQFIEVASVADCGITLAQPVDARLSSTLRLSNYLSELYYIRNTQRRDRKGLPITALYRRYQSLDRRHHPSELLAQIHQFTLHWQPEKRVGLDLLASNDIGQRKLWRVILNAT